MQPLGSLDSTAKAAVRELLLAGRLSRAELARRLELSPSSLTKTARLLIDSGFVLQEEAQGADVRGRPGVPLVLNADEHQFAGVKVTADAVYGVRADALGAVLHVGKRVLTKTTVDAVVHEIVDLLKEMQGSRPLQAMGVGLAGTMLRFDDTVRRNAYLGWDDVPLASILEHETGIPVVLSGDVRALTAGVQWAGPGRGHRDFAVLTIGVGIGAGVVVDGQVLAGDSGNAGLVSHTRITDSGPLCPLGHRGCASSFLTTHAITTAVGTPAGRTDLSLPDVCALAANGDAVAGRVLRDGGTALGVLISDVVNLLGSPVVIVAGDGLGILDHARTAMDRAIDDHLDPGATRPRIEIFRSDFDEWARGAAVVARQWLLSDTPSPHPN